MKQTITESQFVDAFDDCNRSDNFSRAGRRTMFEFFEQWDAMSGIETEFDVIAICCEFSEYENLKEFQDNYGGKYKIWEDIDDVTTVMMIDDESFIIQDF